MNRWQVDLSFIEWQLLRALAAGVSNKHIARERGKSEYTVRNQLAILFKKIGVNNRAQAVNWYHEYLYVTEAALIGTSVPLPAPDSRQRISKQ